MNNNNLGAVVTHKSPWCNMIDDNENKGSLPGRVAGGQFVSSEASRQSRTPEHFQKCE